MRLMTRFKRAGVVLDDTIPNYKTMLPGFLVKLIVAWTAMGFRRPKISW